jgi:DNA modification methylase
MSKSLINSRPLQIEYVSPHRLRPYPGNARTHSRKQLRALENSIRRFGYTQPALVGANDEIIAGHGRVEAARNIGLPKIPIIRIQHLSDIDRRAYILADNQLALKAGWDKEILAVELQNLIEVGFDLEIIGFEAPEVDLTLNAILSDDETGSHAEDAVTIAPLKEPPITEEGDLWLLRSGDSKHHHRVICGDARDTAVLNALMKSEQADMILTDPPFNVRVKDISGKGRTRHAEFAMASGEMREDEYVAFLRQILAAVLPKTFEGALLYLFMDWRHLFETLTAARLLDLSLINLCVWNKTNGGMGSLYRSKHELVLVLSRRDRTHRNNVQLGKHGRNRSNVWDYAGANIIRSGRDAELAMHPTVKPVAMLADAIYDVTERGDIVLDPFGGSGSTVIAAEKSGRLARVIEIDRRYCDTIIRRWEDFTGEAAILAETGETFATIAKRRSKSVSQRKASKSLPTYSPRRRSGAAQ